MSHSYTFISKIRRAIWLKLMVTHADCPFRRKVTGSSCRTSHFDALLQLFLVTARYLFYGILVIGRKNFLQGGSDGDNNNDDDRGVPRSSTAAILLLRCGKKATHSTNKSLNSYHPNPWASRLSTRAWKFYGDLGITELDQSRSLIRCMLIGISFSGNKNDENTVLKSFC